MNLESGRQTSELAGVTEESIEGRRQFIDSLDVEPADDRGEMVIAATETAPTAAVADGSLLSFVGNLSGQDKEDVLNSTLLAQLAANKKHNRFDRPIEWYNWYLTVLENVGWNLPSFNFSRLDSKGKQAAVDRVVLEVLQAVATGNEAAIVKRTIDALKSLDPGDRRIRLFEKGSHSSNQGNFQIAAAVEDRGDVLLKLGAFHFMSTSNVTRVLFWSFSSATASFNLSASTILLNKQVYARVRDSVLAKLGRTRQEFVDDLEI